MPWYRINGMDVHMKGTKLPAPCGARVWIEGQARYCRGMSAYLCDFPSGARTTCDRALCDAHAHQVGPDQHHCPECVEFTRVHDAQQGLFTGLIGEVL